jgi:sRNA-binding carbon storage regulator CsrA
LDTKIKELNTEINNIVDTAKTKIGYAPKGAAVARKELNNRLKATKERYDSDLLEFKTNIRSRKLHKYPS